MIEADADVLRACQSMAGNRLIALVWLDAELVATRSYGTLASLVPLGVKVTEGLLPLVGLDEALLELQTAAEPATFEMPNVSVAVADGAAPRLNIVVYWMGDSRRYLLALTRVVSAGDLETGLAQQARARLIAEAEVARQSRALAAANAELTRANRDLAEFAYVLSHDLKAPLRALRYHAEDLRRLLPEGRKDEADALAERIISQSRRMSRMMTDLLSYSRIGRESDARELVDTRALVAEIAGSLPRRGDIAINIEGDWPTIETDAAPLDLVLRNLIGNAIAHHDRQAGSVVVAACVEHGRLRITVADDGPGIPLEWQEAIFQPFKTIREPTEDGGSGIGLALVRRTIEAVGAQLSLISDPLRERGTRFVVSWPL